MTVGPFSIVTLVVGISLVWAALKQRPFRFRLWKPFYWLVLSQVLFFPAAIAVGRCGHPQRARARAGGNSLLR